MTRARTYSAAVAMTASLGSFAMAADLQFGIRLDSRSSIQWNGQVLYAQSERRYVTRTSAGTIREVWPGPRRGLFAIHTERGVGLLLGTDALVLSVPDPPAAILRSSRPDAVWTGYVDGSRSVVREWRPRGGGRELLRTPGALRDFDVSADGWLVVLFDRATLVVRAPNGPPRAIVAPRHTGSPLRVFLTKDHAELAVLGPGELCRTPLDGPQAWSCEPFDHRSDAVVRHVWNGRAALEERFVDSDPS